MSTLRDRTRCGSNLVVVVAGVCYCSPISTEVQLRTESRPVTLATHREESAAWADRGARERRLARVARGRRDRDSGGGEARRGDWSRHGLCTLGSAAPPRVGSTQPPSRAHGGPTERRLHRAADCDALTPRSCDAHTADGAMERDTRRHARGSRIELSSRTTGLTILTEVVSGLQPVVCSSGSGPRLHTDPSVTQRGPRKDLQFIESVSTRTAVTDSSEHTKPDLNSRVVVVLL
ncbi:unnamed protein product [Lampetra planeri]